MSMSVVEQLEIPPRVVRYGVDEPLPARRLLRAGPLTAVLEGGDLRYVRYGDEEIVRRVYGAVRDQNWGTVIPRFTRYEVEEDDNAFAVRFTAEHVEGDIHFRWNGSFIGTSGGVITCSFDGESAASFLRNRIGWCVLHPMAVAGLPATAVTPDAEVAGEFPERISPHQPFFDLRELRHPTRHGGEVIIRFDGDLFEMEDQRNWSDASYKTYSTPLRIPYPVRIEPGDRVRQTMTIEVKGGATTPMAEFGGEPSRVDFAGRSVAKLPPIGFGTASHGKALSERESALVVALRPGHLRPVVMLDAEDWRERLERALDDAKAVGAALEVEAVCDAAGNGLDPLCRLLVERGADVARLLVFDHASGVTTDAVIDQARRAAETAGLAVPIGGGSRAYFTQLNRASLPLDRMDVVGYGINPQVHAFDNGSLVETLAAQVTTVESARLIAGDRPLAVGPVTLRPRYNPDATGPEAKPAAGELPASVDPRQSSLFAAGWTIGSVRSLAVAGADSVTFFETTGWRGLIERSDHALRVPGFSSAPGWTFPVYHVFADLAEVAGGEVLASDVGDPMAMTALGVRDGSSVVLLIASFLESATEVELTCPSLHDGMVRLLDETNYRRAVEDPTEYRRAETRSLDLRRGHVALSLSPFALATVRGRLA